MSEYAEESVTIQGPVRLEGRLSRVSGEEGLVVTHPHPLYGGSMDNNVVKALVRAGKEAGMSTLRFNFRGVGGSQGTHGRGPAERDDLRAALEMFAAEGFSRLVVAGYSFGAWVAATADYGGLPVAGCVWVAPPMGMMPLKPGQVTRAPDLVVYGGRDSFCPVAGIISLLNKIAPDSELVRLEGRDHFFGGFEAELVRLVSGFLARLPREGR